MTETCLRRQDSVCSDTDVPYILYTVVVDGKTLDYILDKRATPLQVR